MQYTTLGKRTGLKVSVLGFGAMRLPMTGNRIDRNKAIPMIHYAFEHGVNYIDTAVGYCNRDSQRVVGEALRGWRDRIIVSTKNHTYARSQYDVWHRNLEDSLKRLKTDHIDIYNLHGLNLRSFRNEVVCKGGSYAWMQKAKDQGLIRHICFSFHDTPEALAEIASSDLFDSVTCQYNLLNPENSKAFKTIKKHGLGIVVMGPVGGGRLGAPSEALRKLVPGAKSVPEVAMRFVLATPEVDIALSGMSTMEQVKENCRVCSRKTPLSNKEKQNVKRVLNRYKKLAKLYCTGCGYCMPCPSGVNIPANFDSLNQLRVYGLEAQAKASYARLSGPAHLCVACGKCMVKCPQKIRIISQLRETVRELDKCYNQLDVSIRPRSLKMGRKKGARDDVMIRAALEFVNYSDNDVPVNATFSPAGGIEVAPTSNQQTLKPFGRSSVPLVIKGKARLSDGVDLGLKIKSTSEVTGASPVLNLALARPGGARGVNRSDALDISNKTLEAGRQSGVSAHKASFRAAYDRETLRLRLRLMDDRSSLKNKARNRGNSDKVLVDFDVSGLVKPKGEMPVIVKRRMEVLLPEQGKKQCPVSISGGGDKKDIKAVSKGWCKRLEIDVSIPWRAIGCSPGKTGRVLGLNVRHISYSARGKQQIDREWARGGGWVILV